MLPGSGSIESAANGQPSIMLVCLDDYVSRPLAYNDDRPNYLMSRV